MNKSVTTVCLTLGLSALLSVQLYGRHREASQSSVGDEESVKQLEHEMSNAAAHNDGQTYQRIMADDFIGNWADGSKTTKKEEIEMLHSGNESYQANEIVELAVRVFGDTAIATGKNTETSVIEGKNATGVYKFTDIFLKRNGRWQQVASQTARPIPYGAKCVE